MSEDHLEREVLGRVRMDRRRFIKKMLVGTVFAVPMIASFDMLATSVASGQTCTTANGTSGTGGTGGAGGASLSDRDLKTAITPVSWD